MVVLLSLSFAVTVIVQFPGAVALMSKMPSVLLGATLSAVIFTSGTGRLSYAGLL